MLQTRGRMLAPNLMSVSQLRLSFSGFPEGGAEAPSRPSLRKDPDEGRRSPPSRLHKQLLGRAVLGKCAEGRERRSGPPGRSGFLPVYRSDVENPRCRSRSPVRCTPGSPSFSPVDESLGLPHGRTQRSHAPVPLHAEGRSRNLRKGGHDPVVELPQASVNEGEQALEGEGGGHGPRGGNWRSGVLRRLA